MVTGRCLSHFTVNWLCGEYRVTPIVTYLEIVPVWPDMRRDLGFDQGIRQESP